MGETRVDIEICGVKKCKLLEKVLIDSGSATTFIPKKLGEDLGVAVLGKQEFDTPKGKLIGEVGMAKVRLLGKETWSPIVLVKEEMSGIGFVTLELARFKVNPLTGKLEEIGEPLRL